jgi:2-enoate reductase
VTLLEKRDRLGGASVPGHNPEFKRELDRLPVWYAEQLERAGVDVRLAHDATVDSVLALAPDVVAFARGASPVPSPFEVSDDVRVVQAVEVLDREPGTGQEVVVVGAGFVGCETAVHLARSGHRVSLLTRRRAEDLAADLNYTVRLALRALMEESKVRIVPTCSPRTLTGSGIVVVDEEGEETELAADLVVVARGFTQDTALADSLSAQGVEVHLIGETVRTGLILNALHQGFAFGLGL